MKTVSLFHFFLLLGWCLSAFAAADGEPSGAEIIQHCYFKYAGDDQRSRLIIILTDKTGKDVKSEYRRLWKNSDGKNGVVDKVILFAESPLDMRGVNFMRWGYAANTGKLADQWVYLPEMNMVRRVSQRDPNNMDWGYTDEDLRIRGLEEDEHTLTDIVRIDGEEFYQVESVPRGVSAYSKRVTRFNKSDDWQGCAPRQVDYYDKSGQLLKQETILWDKIGDAWVWNTATMHNVQTNVSATYLMLSSEINVGLSDQLFSERQLRRDYPGP